MRNAVIRIAMWASAGFLVSVGWGVYFSNADKAIPIGPTVYALAEFTEPIAAVVLYLDPTYLLGLRSVVVANAATYALLGLIVETFRRRPPVI